MNLNKLDKWEVLMLSLTDKYTYKYLANEFEMELEYFMCEIQKIKNKVRGNIKYEINVYLRNQLLKNYDRLNK